MVDLAYYLTGNGRQDHKYRTNIDTIDYVTYSIYGTEHDFYNNYCSFEAQKMIQTSIKNN